MINSVAFASRLKVIMEYYNLSASAFSDEIDFNRSTISHLISGRNKPSLEFVMKVLKRFPEVQISWLLYGKGDFPSIHIDEDKLVKRTLVNQTKEPTVIEESKSQNPITHNKSTPPSLFNKISNSRKEIKKIVVFYTDFTFETYEN